MNNTRGLLTGELLRHRGTKLRRMNKKCTRDARRSRAIAPITRQPRGWSKEKSISAAVARRTRHAQFIFIPRWEILGKYLHERGAARARALAHVILIYKFVKCRCAPTAKLQPKLQAPGTHPAPATAGFARVHLSVLSFGGKQFIVYALSAHLSRKRKQICIY